MKPTILILTLALVLAGPSCAAGPSESERARVIVLTDITNEPDDEESMVRFLVYANEYDVEGLIATTSVWLRDQVRPDKIRERVEAYGEVRPNLIKHAEGYPTRRQLLEVIRSGRPEFGMQGVGQGKSSEGSRHIIQVVDKPDPRPAWVTVWGGANCLAQALWEVKNTRSPEELEKFVSKVRVYTISDQDDSGRWMRDTFADLIYVVSPSAVDSQEYYRATWTGISGDRHYRNGPGHKWDLVTNEWLEANVIRNHGPLGALYPKWEYIMEGDTPSFLGLINNGLASYLSPAYGGWGGRYVLYEPSRETRPIWTNAADGRDTVTADDGNEYTSAQATIWRWREAYQNDFAARMNWCVASAFEQANHNPVVVVNGDASKKPVEIELSAGDTVALSALGTTDPDGNALSYRWFHYREVESGSVQKRIELTGADEPEARVKLIEGTRGRGIHLILEVKDDGEPALFAYRRVILRVK